MRVLVVDDEPEIVEFLTVVLERHQIQAVGVFSPIEAVALTEKESFDAIITDFKMPKMTGLEMIAQIRSGSLNAQTPTIVLSGNLTDELLVRLEKLGIIDVMSKPPEIDILIRVIEKSAQKKPKKTTATYNDKIIRAFSNAFKDTMLGHLGEHVRISNPALMEAQPSEIEFCGLASVFGQRLSGMICVSYQRGFTHEFARILLGRAPSSKELEIFEATTGEIADQVFRQAMPMLQAELGLHAVSAAPLIIQGRRAGIPMPASQPRIHLTATLAGKNCYFEFSFFDLAQNFGGAADHAATQILL